MSPAPANATASGIQRNDPEIFSRRRTLQMRPNIPDYSNAYSKPRYAPTFEACASRITALQQSAPAPSGRHPAVTDLLAHAVYGSNLIERVGCPLSETQEICNEVFCAPSGQLESQQVLEELVLRGARDAAHLLNRREVVNHAAAFAHLVRAVAELRQPISEQLILATHRILVNGIPTASGVQSAEYGGLYRVLHVAAGSTGFVPPHEVPGVMKRFVSELQQLMEEAESEVDPFYIAAFASSEFVNIHPFLDGNGRTCRMVLNVVLLRYAGFVAPIGEDEEDREAYLAICRRGSEQMCGCGELAGFVLARCELMLATIDTSTGS